MMPSACDPAPRRRPLAASSPAFRTSIAGGLILLLCLLAYLPALQGKFLWDDLYLVGANPFFKSPRFLGEVFRHFLYLDSFSLYYRPVQNISYMLDYLLWNQQEFGYHLSNVLFHAASAFLLFLVLRRSLTQLAAPSPAFAEGASFAVALLWAVHPIHNAAVAYVAGRADSLAMMFALAGWLLFLAEASAWRAVAAAILAPLCFLIALCAKEIAFVWIGLFLVYLFGFESRRPWRAKLRIAGSLLAALGVYLVLRHLPGTRPAQAGLEVQPFADRVILMFRALGDYTGLILFPGNLHMERTVFNGSEYASKEAWQNALRGDYLSLLGLLAIGIFIYACRSRRPGRKIRILGVAWFVLGFLPISNLFPLNAQVAEHWIYMASAGFLLMLAGFACAVPPRQARLLAYAVPVAVVALGVRAAYRAADWSDPETFFKQTIAAGGSSDRASLNLANIYSDRGDLERAEGVLRDALQRFPGYPTARLNLGMNLIRQGRNAEAEALLKFSPAASAAVAASTPRSWTAALNLAHIQYSGKHPEAALALLDDAIRQYPGIWDLVYFRAQILWMTKDAGTALPCVQEFASARWWHYESHVMLGQLRAASGDFAGGVTACREAASLDIHSSVPYENLARAAVAAKRLPEALEAQAEAIERNPDQPHEYVALAAILQKMNQPADAMAALRKADSLRLADGAGS